MGQNGQVPAPVAVTLVRRPPESTEWNVGRVPHPLMRTRNSLLSAAIEQPVVQPVVRHSLEDYSHLDAMPSSLVNVDRSCGGERCLNLIVFLDFLTELNIHCHHKEIPF
jgi:hypothetical protein